ncbi:hypothetical protein SmJEL517_g01317 [Synchytrium microbalum]|uniref:Enoyl reductase (ER) domain-containing protein n=1 Tax=Synchytrium microbalum TaxID=1806994 RepID=A0A507CG91_9FUNG|nr:uncharacterized protein SmJEL517_g01317 [Synchytrium microbalum]TPX36493.1 hypothetical protein SmJEL517_g01317 [Synchytrium microbalum]
MTRVNRQVYFVKRPAEGLFDPKETFELRNGTIPELQDGDVLVRTVLLSLDPAMRTWMSGGDRSYTTLPENIIMRGSIVGIVVESKDANYAVGDRVIGGHGWQDYGVSKGNALIKIPANTSLEHSMSVLGGVGLTAYFGLIRIGNPVKGDTVVVSAAAGATGSITVQIAKILGCRVVAIAGGPDKCAWVKSLGADVCLDYKAKDFAEQLTAATPNEINVYFDNTGGSILDLCLSRLAMKGRVVLCGAIATYNEKEVVGPSKYLALLFKRARMEGFIVTDFLSEFDQGRQQLQTWLSEGKIKSTTTIVDGLENAPAGLLKLFTGDNTGKLMVKVSDE